MKNQRHLARRPEHRASDRHTGLAVGRNEASYGLVPLLLRQ